MLSLSLMFLQAQNNGLLGLVKHVFNSHIISGVTPPNTHTHSKSPT